MRNPKKDGRNGNPFFINKAGVLFTGYRLFMLGQTQCTLHLPQHFDAGYWKIRSYQGKRKWFKESR
nr:hypothetical protein [Mediterraneibacter glycyrrhizinilyticus]